MLRLGLMLLLAVMPMKVRDRYDSLFQHYNADDKIDWRYAKAQAMAESALNLGGRNFHKLGIQHHHAIGPHRHAGGGAERGIPKDADLQMTATSGLEKLVGEILEQRIVAQARFAAGFREVVGRGAHAAHDGTTKIHEKLLVFHAARAG